MVHKLFSIYTHPEESHKLYLEVGSHHIACWCAGPEEAFTALEYFTFTYDNTEGGFIDVFRELKRCSILLSNTFASQEIVWENASFMCVPNGKFTHDTALSYMNITTSQSFQSPPMRKQLPGCVLVFTADALLYKIVTQNLPHASHTHKFFHLLQRNAGGNSLQIQFYQSHFLLAARKNGALQLATVYRFHTPQEAVYHLLNTLDKLDMPKEETITSLSGFIDETSALYKEIYLYVNNLQLAQAGKIKNEYPAHYFTTYNLPVA